MNPGEPTFNAGDQYEDYVGRWSRPVAQEFVDWLDIPPRNAWLDVGCGTGAVVAAVLEQANPLLVTGIDPSPAFVDYARSRTGDARATFVVADAHALPNHLVDFDAVVSGLVLNFLQDPHVALGQMVAAAKPGGTIAAYVWDYADEMQMMRYFWDAATELEPAAVEFDEGRKETLCKPAALARFFGRSLVQVGVTEIVTPTVFNDFDDYWRPFLGGQGSAPSYLASLTYEQRERLKASVRRRLPCSETGAIHLIARAWAVKGTRPVRAGWKSRTP